MTNGTAMPTVSTGVSHVNAAYAAKGARPGKSHGDDRRTVIKDRRIDDHYRAPSYCRREAMST